MRRCRGILKKNKGVGVALPAWGCLNNQAATARNPLHAYLCSYASLGNNGLGIIFFFTSHFQFHSLSAFIHFYSFNLSFGSFVFSLFSHFLLKILSMCWIYQSFNIPLTPVIQIRQHSRHFVSYSLQFRGGGGGGVGRHLGACGGG